MKKTILATALSIFCAISAAAGYTHSLLLTKTSGETVEYQFLDNPTLTMAGEVINLNSDNGRITVPVVEVKNITFESEYHSLETLSPEEKPSVTVEFSNERIAMHGIGADSELAIFTTDGRKIGSTRADGEGYAEISIIDLPGGVYIAHSSAHSFKFSK